MLEFYSTIFCSKCKNVMSVSSDDITGKITLSCKQCAIKIHVSKDSPIYLNFPVDANVKTIQDIFNDKNKSEILDKIFKLTKRYVQDYDTGEYGKKLIAFMFVKSEILGYIIKKRSSSVLKHGAKFSFSSEEYFSYDDAVEISYWSDLTCDKIYNKIRGYIFLDDEIFSEKIGLASEVCPFCIYSEMSLESLANLRKQEDDNIERFFDENFCAICEYAKNHRMCKDPDSDLTNMYNYYLTVQETENIFTRDLYKDILNRIDSLDLSTK